MRSAALSLMLLLSALLAAQTGDWSFYDCPSMKSPMLATPNYIYYGNSPGLARINTQTLSVERFYSFNSGLGMGRIYSLYYDSGGILWIGGDNRLASFDGENSWQTHDLSSAPGELGRINAIQKDSAGNLWLGCANGLFKTDLSTWEVFTTANTPLSTMNVLVMLIDHLDRVWIGTSTDWGDLAYFDGNTWTLAGPDWGTFYFIAQDRQNTIWLGCDLNLKSFDGTAWTQHADPGLPSVPWYYFQSCAVDNNNHKYFGTLYGDVIKYTGSAWSRYYNINDTYNEGSPYSMATDSQNNLFFGAGTVYRNQALVANVSQIHNYNNATAFRSDHQGRIWTVHSGGGVSCFDGASWQCFDSDDYAYLVPMCNDLAFDSGDTLWVANDNRIVNYHGGNWWTQQPPESLLPYRHYRRIEIDPRDNVWIGGNYGLLRKEGNFWQAYTTANSPLPSNMIKDLAQDTQGKLWIATNSGIACYDRGTWQVFTQANSPFPQTDIRSVFCDQSGRVWARAVNYLYCYDQLVWTAFPIPGEGTETSNQSDMGVDQQGRLWVNLMGGNIGIFSDGAWTLINNTNSSLQSYTTYALSSEPNGRIWLSVYGGLQTWYVTPVSEPELENPPVGEINLSVRPNPFNPSTVLSFSLPEPQTVSLLIYNLKGQLVKQLCPSLSLSSGEHRFLWTGDDSQGRELASGVYLLKLETSRGSAVRMITLLK